MANSVKRGDFMRVIAGKLGGRKLKAVPNKRTRPTSDRVKEAAFQIIGPFFQEGKCLDLFSGSGSLGIEAISRGIDHTVFIDKQQGAIHTIKENIRTMKITEQTEVYQMDAFQALRVLGRKKDHVFDLILIDPPYKTVEFDTLFNEIEKFNLLKENGIIFCEHDPSEHLPQTYGDLQTVKKSNYGKTTSITIYRKQT